MPSFLGSPGRPPGASSIGGMGASAMQETYNALPPADRPFSDYDFQLVAEIIQGAEADALALERQGKGIGEVTLQRLLKAYERVLPKYQVLPEEDIYYYRFLLKLSLDPNPNWWAKLHREATGAAAGAGGTGVMHTLRTVSPRATGAPPAAPAARPRVPVFGARGLMKTPVHRIPTAAGGKMPPPPTLYSTPAAPASAAQQQLPPGRAAASSHLPDGSYSSGPAPAAPAYHQPQPSPLGGAHARATPHAARNLAAASSLGGGGYYSPSGGGGGYGQSSPYAQATGAGAGARVLAPGQATGGPYATQPSGGRAASSPGRWLSRPIQLGVGPAVGTSYGGYAPTGGYDSDGASIAGSEAEAFAEFKRAANAFRTWRLHAYILAESRGAREEALHNWGIALSFWEVHLTRRLLLRWAGHRQRVLLVVLTHFWAGAVRRAWLRWREVAVRLQFGNLLSGTHLTRKLYQKCFTWWARWAALRRAMGSMTASALMHWTGKTTETVFRTWQLLAQQSIKGGRHADDFYMRAARGKLFVLWRRAAAKEKELRLKGEAIQQAGEEALLSRAASAWLASARARRRSHGLLAHALSMMCHRGLARAINGMREHVARKRRTRTRVASALGHWRHRSLGEGWNAWRGAVVVAGEKRAQMSRSAAHWTQRSVAAGWGSWRALMDLAASNEAAADAFLRPRLLERVGHEIIGAWRGAVEERRHDLAAFDAIALHDATRLKNAALGAMLTCYDKSVQLGEAGVALAAGTRRRVLRHWAAYTSLKLDRDARWAAALAAATHARKSRLFLGLRLVTAIRAEHRSLLARATRRRRARVLARALSALRAHVERRIEKRAKLLGALLHWDTSVRSRALRGWAVHLANRRRKGALAARARRHATTRVLQRCLDALSRYAESGTAAVARAHAFWAVRVSSLARESLRAWRGAASVRGVKSAKMRRAVAHWTGGMLGSAFYAWHAGKQRGLVKRAKMSLALLRWSHATLFKAFSWWRDSSLYKVSLQRRATAYLALLLGRAAAFAFYMLRANAVRKMKSRGAWVWWHRATLRKGFQGWRFRVVVRGDLEVALRGVARKWLGASLAEGFRAWRALVAMRGSKRVMLRAALLLWMTSRLRGAFSALRWYHLRKQMARGVVLRWRYGAALRALRGWRDAAHTQRMLKARVMDILYRTDLSRMREALAAWAQWIVLKHSGQLATSRAAGHLTHMLLARAWNSWCDAVLLKRQQLDGMAACLVRWRHNALARTFEKLRAHVDRRHAKRAADWHWLQGRGREVLLAWRMQAKLQIAVALWTGNVLLPTFLQWRTVIKRKVQLRLTAEVVARRWLLLSASTALHTWRDNVRDIGHGRAKLRHCVGHWVSRMLARAFGAWVSYLRWKDSMRGKALAIVARLQGGAKLRAFNSWRYFMALRARARMAIVHWVNRLLRSALLEWRAAAGEKVEAVGRATELFRKIALGMASESLSGCFWGWRNLVVRMNRLRLVLTRQLERFQGLAFFGWLEEATWRKRARAWAVHIQRSVSERLLLHEAVLGALARWTLWPLSYAFYSWLWKVREHQNLKERATLALFGYAGGLLRKAWLTWRSYASAKAEMADRLFSVLLTMGALRRGRAFYWWLALTQYMRHMDRCFSFIREKREVRIRARAWSVLRYRSKIAHAARKVVARWAFAGKLAALRQWRAGVLAKLAKKDKVRSVLSKILNRSLAKAWQSWRGLVADRSSVRRRILSVLSRIHERALTKALNTWIAYWRDARKATLADVTYFGGLLDRGWLAWQQAMELSELERGNGAKKKLVFARVLAGWRGQVAAGRTARGLQGAFDGALAAWCLAQWQWAARAAAFMRRMLLRRGLHGWYERVVHWQAQREKLLAAAQLLMAGMLARAFQTWRLYTSTQAAKGVVFAQKQAALQTALRFGERLRQRRHAELLGLTFRAWRFKTGIFRKVALRFSSVAKRTLHSSFLQWHAFVVGHRAKVHSAVEHRRARSLRRALAAWRAAAAQLADVSAENAEAAEDHWKAATASKTLGAWSEWAAIAGARRAALTRVLQSQVDAENKALILSSLLALRELVSRRVSMFDMAEAASTRRTARVMGEVFDVWHAYTAAMRADLDPGSPFLSPRSTKGDRALIRRVTHSLGGVDPDVAEELATLGRQDGGGGSSGDASSTDGADASFRASVMSTREAYLRLASPRPHLPSMLQHQASSLGANSVPPSYRPSYDGDGRHSHNGGGGGGGYGGGGGFGDGRHTLNAGGGGGGGGGYGGGGYVDGVPLPSIPQHHAVAPGGAGAAMFGDDGGGDPRAYRRSTTLPSPVPFRGMTPAAPASAASASAFGSGALLVQTPAGGGGGHTQHTLYSMLTPMWASGRPGGGGGPGTREAFSASTGAGTSTGGPAASAAAALLLQPPPAPQPLSSVMRASQLAATRGSILSKARALGGSTPAGGQR
ncbi:hypothetical protein FOA52_007923 [Chlamydomonas sp. UWO 241]|nr:hypothetical protein FOA52_007923 [Chlamydomonas sp. UWO 241]